MYVGMHVYMNDSTVQLKRCVRNRTDDDGDDDDDAGGCVCLS